MIFGLNYNYEIENLDELYYKLYKFFDENERSKLNQSYLILKDPFLRAKYLCKKFVDFQEIDVSKVFQIIETEKNIDLYKNNLLKNIIQKANNRKFEECSNDIQIYTYLNKIFN